jgi:hypothetical protein
VIFCSNNYGVTPRWLGVSCPRKIGLLGSHDAQAFEAQRRTHALPDRSASSNGQNVHKVHETPSGNHKRELGEGKTKGEIPELIKIRFARFWLDGWERRACCGSAAANIVYFKSAYRIKRSAVEKVVVSAGLSHSVQHPRS